MPFLCAQYLTAATLYVGPGQDYTHIQDAINNAGNTDTIIVSEGTYEENINFLGKAVTLTSENPDDPNVIAATIIDGSMPPDPNNASTVTFNSGETNDSILTGFTITGGTGTWLVIAWDLHEPYWNRCGGGIVCCNMSEPTITKNVITENTTGEGGGIYIYGNPVNIYNPSNPPLHISPVISHNTITNNSAVADHGFSPPNNDYTFDEHGDGGAIVAFQGVDAAITNNIIQNNQADFYGGGLHLRQWSNGTIADNQILNNNSALGAGIHITYTSAPLINENTIKANVTGGGGGGGIYVYYYSSPAIENNIICQNSSNYSSGIGIYWSSEPLIQNNFIIENYGPAILCNTAGATRIFNNTIASNYEKINGGGGIRCLGSANPFVENNIIAFNQGGYGIYAQSELNSIKHNNVWANELGNYNPDFGDRTGTNGNISADPNFAGIDNFHILPISPCVDAGDPEAAIPTESTDIDSEQRVFNEIVDIGADEVVTNPADFNIDGIVDILDLNTLTNQWLTAGDEQTNLFDDDFIDLADYTIFAKQWLWKSPWHQ